MALYGLDQMAAYAEEQQRRGRKTGIHTIKRIISAFAPYKLQVMLILLTILLTTTLGLVNPLLIARVFDDAIATGNIPLLITYVSIMFIAPVVEGIIGVGETYLNNHVGQHVMRDFRNQLYQHLQGMSLRFFTATRTGEIQSRLTNDVEGVEDVVTNTATDVVANVSTAVSTIIAMLFLSPLLTCVSLALLPFFLWITYKIGEIRRTTSKEMQETIASLTAMMQETLSVSGILLMKTFGRQKQALGQFERQNQQLTDLEMKQQMIGRWLFMIIGTFFSVMPAIVYLIAGLQLIHNSPILGVRMSFGTIVAFTTLQSRIFFPIGQLLNLQIEIQGSLALFDRIFEYLDIPIDITNKPDALNLDSDEVHGQVTFSHVSFTYQHDEGNGDNEDNEYWENQTWENEIQDEEQRPALNNVSLSIEPGQLAALVGPSGAGKTTITYLVARLYDVDSGIIEIDGHNVKDLALESLSGMIGMVTQETFLFHASIKENLLYAHPTATDEEIRAAARTAAIHDRIMGLGDGYDTIVGERGYKLSGGEKQRIAIARVILKNPRILILDEATSALDTHSERYIQNALEPLMKNRTTLAIAHRLSTILAADIILVVNKGEIVERGTHEELLKQGGLYAQLYHEQFAASMQD